MNAPFYQFGLFGNDTALLFAVVIGIGFGFFLEQAGFGSSIKLAQQFYLRDLTVFKVMFTAIVTARTLLRMLVRTDLSKQTVLFTPYTGRKLA